MPPPDRLQKQSHGAFPQHNRESALVGHVRAGDGGVDLAHTGSGRRLASRVGAGDER